MAKPIIDTPVAASLSNGPKTNREIKEDLGLNAEDDRLLDRTLQAMRKKGQIRVVGKRWMVETTQVCAACEGRGWVKEDE